MSDDRNEREVRAARNQSMFRSVNEKMRTLNEAMLFVTEEFVIACECADTSCLEMVTLRPEEYESIRAHPRQFAILAGHEVGPDIEDVVGSFSGGVIVEKKGSAGEVAEQIESLEVANEYRAG